MTPGRVRDYMRGMKITAPLAAVFIALASLSAEVIEGVTVPQEKQVAGVALQLNGAGVRTVKLAFLPIKAYVATFYTPSLLRSEKEVLATKGPLQFNFTFLHGVGQGQVTEAWNAQFEASVTHQYAGLAADQKKFVGLFGPLKKGEVETVEIVGDETLVYDGGTFKGAIKGRDFQKAFLSMWFGSKPVMPSLKSELLGN